MPGRPAPFLPAYGFWGGGSGEPFGPPLESEAIAIKQKSKRCEQGLKFKVCGPTLGHLAWHFEDQGSICFLIRSLLALRGHLGGAARLSTLCSKCALPGFAKLGYVLTWLPRWFRCGSLLRTFAYDIWQLFAFSVGDAC